MHKQHFQDKMSALNGSFRHSKTDRVTEYSRKFFCVIHFLACLLACSQPPILSFKHFVFICVLPLGFYFIAVFFYAKKNIVPVVLPSYTNIPIHSILSVFDVLC